MPTILRSGGDIARLTASQPFTPTEVAATEGRVQVILLRGALSDEAVASGPPGVPESDLVRVRRSEVFWLPKRGVADSELDMKALETFAGPFTVRTLNTIGRIASRL